MGSHAAFVGTLMAGLVLAQPALACRVPPQLRPERVTTADAVVLGSITDYEVVRDEARRRERLRAPNLTTEDRERIERQYQSSGYGRFQINVDQVLSGDAPRRFSATARDQSLWIPEWPGGGQYLIALDMTYSPDEISDYVKEPGLPSVVGGPCQIELLLPADSERAREVRAVVDQMAAETQSVGLSPGR